MKEKALEKMLIEMNKKHTDEEDRLTGKKNLSSIAI